MPPARGRRRKTIMTADTTYLYETHLHTKEGSLCGRVTAAEQVALYHRLGYTGIVVTDHFFTNGSCRVPADLPWEERVRRFYDSYYAALEEGEKVGLQVFFAFEHSYHGNDFLVYGLEMDWLIAHPDLDKLPLLDFLRLVRGAGAVVIHAHPYRRAHYIDMIRLVPDDVDGVEVMNACRSDFDNDLARAYAAAYDLAPSAGSDNHHGVQARYGAVASPRRFSDVRDLAHAIVAREVTPVTVPGEN